MPEIVLANSRGIVLIDEEDLPRVSGLSWQLRHGYAAAWLPGGRRLRKLVLMHRLLLGAIAGQMIDHVNRNKLDNRRDNLRLCTSAENARNRLSGDRNRRWPFKGVTFDARKKAKPWRGYISNGDGRVCHLGYFATAEDAARAYDIAALVHHRAFACLNFPPSPVEVGQ